jgi:serine/threonine-protein kinase RsbW
MTTNPRDTVRSVAVMAYSTADDLAPVRAFVRDHAERLGLAADRLTAVALATSELVTNTLQHTTEGGRVRIWGDDGSVFCDVVDSGPPRTFGRAMPPPDADRGRGLAIVERLCDDVISFAEAGCTVVRLRFATPPRRAAG